MILIYLLLERPPLPTRTSKILRTGCSFRHLILFYILQVYQYSYGAVVPNSAFQQTCMGILALLGALISSMLLHSEVLF